MVGRVVWGWVGVKLKPALLSAVGIHSSHSQKCAVWPKYSAGSTSQATCLLKAMAKPAEGYAFGLKSPKTEKKYFEMHYTSKLRVIVRSSLENISHAVHSATGPQSTKLWCSNAISNWKKRHKGRKEEGWRAAAGLWLGTGCWLGETVNSQPTNRVCVAEATSYCSPHYSSQRRRI